MDNGGGFSLKALDLFVRRVNQLREVALHFIIGGRQVVLEKNGRVFQRMGTRVANHFQLAGKEFVHGFGQLLNIFARAEIGAGGEGDGLLLQLVPLGQEGRQFLAVLRAAREECLEEGPCIEQAGTDFMGGQGYLVRMLIDGGGPLFDAIERKNTYSGKQK